MLCYLVEGKKKGVRERKREIDASPFVFNQPNRKKMNREEEKRNKRSRKRKVHVIKVRYKKIGRRKEKYNKIYNKQNKTR